MLRTLAPQQSLWASVLPEVARGLPPALAEMDTYLGDPALLEPFKAHFSLTEGRPSVPMETYVRLMVLKYRSAPRGALRYPPLSGEGLEVISLGPMAYLDSKDEGDNSMPSKPT
jgi:hypothetical protein